MYYVVKYIFTIYYFKKQKGEKRKCAKTTIPAIVAL